MPPEVGSVTFVPPPTYNQERAMRYALRSPYPTWVSLSNGKKYQIHNLTNPRTGERASFARPWDRDPDSGVTPLDNSGYTRITYNRDLRRYQPLGQVGSWTAVRRGSQTVDFQTQITSGYYDPKTRPALVKQVTIPPGAQYVLLKYTGDTNPFWEPVSSIYTGRFTPENKEFLEKTQSGFTSRVSFMRGAVDTRFYTYLPSTRLDEEPPKQFTLCFCDGTLPDAKKLGAIIPEF